MKREVFFGYTELELELLRGGFTMYEEPTPDRSPAKPRPATPGEFLTAVFHRAGRRLSGLGNWFGQHA